jgi:hypothetical protein
MVFASKVTVANQRSLTEIFTPPDLELLETLPKSSITAIGRSL